MTVKTEAWQKMNPSFKEIWVESLRSGKYLQAKEVLKGGVYRDIYDELGEPVDNELVGEGHCCLGVLCDISGQGKWLGGGYEITFPEPYENEYGELIEVEDSDAELDFYTKKFFGLSDAVAQKLMKMNDDEGYTFADIADWIEENL